MLFHNIYIVLAHLYINISHIAQAQVNYVGGDKPHEECKDLDSEDVESFRAALTDLVKAVSIAHALGKTYQDYNM